MNEMIKNEIELKLKIFLKEKTYTYVCVLGDNDYKLHYNGFIKEINKEYITFTEDILGEIPIIKTKISNVDISNKKKGDNNDKLVR